MRYEFEVQLEGTINRSFPVVYASERDYLELLQEVDFTGKALGIDIETYCNPRTPHPKGGLIPAVSLIRLIQVFDGEQVYIFDLAVNDAKDNWLEFSSNNPVYYTALAEKILWAPSRLCAHNSIFETSQLQKYAYETDTYRPLDIYCSMMMYYLVGCATLPPAQYMAVKNKAGLKDVMKRLFSIELSKEDQSSNWGTPQLSESQLVYSALDAVCTYYASSYLYQGIVENGLETVLDVNRKAQEVIAYMNVHGVCIDPVKHNEFMQKWENEEKTRRSEAEQLLNQHILSMSRDELWGLLTEGADPEFCQMLPSFLEEDKPTWIETLFSLQKEIDTVYEQITGTKGQSRKDKSQLNKLSKNLKKLLISMNSTKQLSEWLKENLSPQELAEWPKSESGKGLSTDAEAFLDHGNLPIVAPIARYRKLAKLSSTYGQNLYQYVVDHTQDFHYPGYRIHPNYTLCKADTGRMTSYEPNLQNIPANGEGKELRSIFVCRPGNRVFITADYSQIELRIAAYYAQDEVLLHAYEHGIDIHALTAASAVGVSVDQVTKEQRSSAKPRNFLLIYGGGAAALRRGAKMQYGIYLTEEQSENDVSSWRDLYKGIRNWQVATTGEAAHSLMTTTPLGKKRLLDDNNYYTCSLNNPVQGGGAELILLAAIDFMNELLRRKLDCYLVNIVHDEFDLDCHADCAEEVISILKASMEKAMNILFPEATTNGLIGVAQGRNWYEAK